MEFHSSSRSRVNNMNAPLFSQLEFLRAHVESVASSPTAIMITSAKIGDGKTLTSYGLAERLVDAGRKVVVLQARLHELKLPGTRSEVEARLAFPIVRLPREDDSSSIATSSLRAKIDELRATYDYTIVDSSPLLQSRVATLLAGMVDAIIVTVRLGRPADSDDSNLVQFLGRADSHVLGVVAASPEDIAAFAARTVNEHSKENAPTTFAPIGEFTTLDRAAVPSLQGLRP